MSERKKWQTTVEQITEYMQDAESTITTLRSEVERLREYVRHKEGCKYIITRKGRRYGAKDNPIVTCTCGLDELPNTRPTAEQIADAISKQLLGDEFTADQARLIASMYPNFITAIRSVLESSKPKQS